MDYATTVTMVTILLHNQNINSLSLHNTGHHQNIPYYGVHSERQCDVAYGIIVSCFLNLLTLLPWIPINPLIDQKHIHVA